MADDQEATPAAAPEPLSPGPLSPEPLSPEPLSRREARSREAALEQERESVRPVNDAIQPEPDAVQSERDAVRPEGVRLDSVGPERATGGRLDLAGPWRRVSPKYVAVEVVSAVVSSVVLLAVPTFLLLIGVDWAWILVVAAAILAVTLLIVAPRRARAYGYRLREDDLLFRRGIMFQRFVSVPYGRMQLIDVNRGPLARALGLADLRFVTAAAATGVSIPGLVDGDAEELRDRLVELAESRRAGL
ncbi:membrane protein YdbS with pleckstrin-like domain [Rathayibacter sp. PhB152]|uniref:PH domain-containing protein n=1 Tax=Rathayibacter sp. PhB152 TaxID=2485190 RepID=UPI000F4B10A9|nr:PH domain-containing protein [Rathayibacter sp. PhB152]ROQ60597.1 membrane protein YdbS with pleckstrin-like domain [Rathayibacter sp. PhB152]